MINSFPRKGVHILLGTICLILIWLIKLPANSNTESAEHARIESTVQEIMHMFNEYQHEDDKQLGRRFAGLVQDLITLDKLAPQIIQKQWPDLNPYEREQFTEAIGVAIASRVVSYLRSNNGVVNLILTNTQRKNSLTILQYKLGDHKLTTYLYKDDIGEWKLRNVKLDKYSIRQYYYGFCKNLLDDYSLANTIAELKQSDYIVLEDFESSTIGALPYRWAWKDKDADRPKPYRVQQEFNNKFLAATDEGESVILGKDTKWNLHEYPYISFRWRGHHIPTGGDERFGKTVDSAAGIYFTVKMKFGLVPESIKYVWSSTLPVGSAMRRSGVGRPWMIVAESGGDDLGEWHTYVFNLYEAYKATFGGDPPKKTVGIGILSDANSTKSKAYADYDDIRALKHADCAGSGVSQILEAE